MENTIEKEGGKKAFVTFWLRDAEVGSGSLN